ncbi:MAG: hypothetical protein CXX81_00655, partial [Methanobacteriota archaeon]
IGFDDLLLVFFALFFKLEYTKQIVIPQKRPDVNGVRKSNLADKKQLTSKLDREELLRMKMIPKLSGLKGYLSYPSNL